MSGELDRSLSELCPITQTWRIGTMHLDLGDILLEDLPQELPRRLRDSLRIALERMLSGQKIPAGNSAGENLRILDHTGSLLELLIWFLQSGTLPWWFKGGSSALQILDEQLDQQPLATIDIIRELGRSEIVRKRLVRQCGEARVRRITSLLEPQHGNFICAFADNLFVMQAEQKLPTSNASEFREFTWLTILSQLLVNRGSLFNTTAFIRANLWQATQHYHIDYHDLLEQVFQAVRILEPAGLISHDFFSAIKAIHLQDRSDPQPQLEAVDVQEPWPVLQKMLRYRLKHHTVVADTVQLDELFTLLAHQDPERMAKLLLQEGKSPGAVQGMLDHFAFAELELVVQVIEPQEHRFIVRYVQHTQARTKLQHWDEKKVWQVLLTYLLADRSSHFNRRQLVHETLQELCRLHKFDFPRFLDLLIHSVQDEFASPQRFELLFILQDLRNEQTRRKAAAESRNPYWQATQHYLSTGRGASRKDIPATQDPQRVFDLLRAASGEQVLAQMLTSSELHTTDISALSQRLLKLVGAAGWPLLLKLIEPEASRYCEALFGKLLQWLKQAGLPSLNKVDLAFQFPALFIQALFGHGAKPVAVRGRFDLATFWNEFTGLLQRQAGVNMQAFHLQLQRCLDREAAQTAADELSLLLRPLLRPKAVVTEPHASVRSAKQAGHMLRDSHESTWSRAQLFHALRLQLAVPCADTAEAVPPALAAISMAELWRLLEQQGEGAVAKWLAQQDDRQQLRAMLGGEHHVNAIERWRQAQLPVELKQPDETLAYLSELFRHGGNWQGADAVLDRTLREVFWAVILDGGAYRHSVGELLASMIADACRRLDIPVSECLEGFASQLRLSPARHWQQAYKVMLGSTAQTKQNADRITAEPSQKVGRNGNLSTVPGRSGFKQDRLAHYLDHPAFIEIARHLLQHGHPPSWLSSSQTVDLNRLLFDVFNFRPELLSAMLKKLQHRPAAMFRLLNVVPFSWLADAISKSAANAQANEMLYRFQKWQEQIDLPSISRQQRNAILCQLTLQHWLKQEWAALEPDRIVGSFLWQLMRQHRISREVLKKAFAPHMTELPPVLRQALSEAIDSEQISSGYSGQEQSIPPARKLLAVIKAAQVPQEQASPIRISNCGLVMLHGFIAALFSRLGMIENQQFVTPDAQLRAVHYLQFLATGCHETAEEHLMLNKLLCGLALHEPVETGIEISAEEEEICQSLLHAVIGYWDAIGDSSIEGLRGNWLVRDGSLIDAGDHWDLVVEKRAYDLLLAQAPFSYSVIKLPWMEKAIYVTWPT